MVYDTFGEDMKKNNHYGDINDIGFSVEIQTFGVVPCLCCHYDHPPTTGFYPCSLVACPQLIDFILSDMWIEEGGRRNWAVLYQPLKYIEKKVQEWEIPTWTELKNSKYENRDDMINLYLDNVNDIKKRANEWYIENFDELNRWIEYDRLIRKDISLFFSTMKEYYGITE